MFEQQANTVLFGFKEFQNLEACKLVRIPILKSKNKHKHINELLVRQFVLPTKKKTDKVGNDREI